MEANKQTLRDKALGRSHTPETRQRLSDIQKGRVLSPEHRARIAAGVKRDYAKKGGTHTPETRAKQSASMVKRLARGEGPTNTFFDTKPELAVEAALKQLGAVYAKQGQVIGVNALWDFIIHDRKLIVEVHGCYWHGCEPCGHIADNPENQARDVAKASAVQARGWTVLAIWDHSVKNGEYIAILEQALS